MCDLKCFLVTYDRLYDKAIDQLDENEIKTIYCYKIQKKVPKNISFLISNHIKEWELPWNDYRYQAKQYYEYGAMIHLLNNPSLISEATHIGLFHYDIIFNKNSIKSVCDKIKENRETIFFQKKRGVEDLYLSPYELRKICEFMSKRLKMNIDPVIIRENGWFSEALSITPKHIFLQFASYLQDNYAEIENILIDNNWGIMNSIKHRVCGIVERMWGFYLMSHTIEKQQLDVIHDWDSYIHKHISEQNWITAG